MAAIKSIKDFDLKGKAVFIRLDLNVPLSDVDAEGVRHVTDDTRIREALPTIQYAIEKGARLVVASHLGRPNGKSDPQYSLEPVALYMAKLIGQDITLADDCVGEGIQMMVRSLKPGQILMLENLRFHGAEEANDPKFSAQLARLTEVYITDAFGTAHRKHSSTYGLPALIERRGVGFLIEKELKFLDQLIHKPAKPFYTVLGGSKVSDKIKTIHALMRHIDGLVVGGAMAFAFSAALGEKVPAGAKVPKNEDIDAARSILREAKKKDMPVLLPVDMIESYDIGPKTIEKFSQFLSSAKTIFWNGPLGWFEKPEYANGTFTIAQAIGKLSALKVVGGGDTVAAIHQSSCAHLFDHLSTGGGAVLEYLEGSGLPGIDILHSNRAPESPYLEPTDPEEDDDDRYGK